MTSGSPECRYGFELVSEYIVDRILILNQQITRLATSLL